MTYSELKLCATRSAFEAVPTPRLKLDLPGVAARIASEGLPVIDARVMLIAGERHEVTIGRDGRILIKVTDPEAARRVFERVRGWIGMA